MATGTITNNGTILFNATADSIVEAGFFTGMYDPASKLATISFAAQSSSNISTTQTLYTIPSGYRPSSNYGVPALVYTSSDIPIASYCRVHSDGTITQNATSTGRKIIATGTYKVG